VKAVEAKGRKAVVYTADLASKEEVAALTPTILKDGHKIQILINCAGIQRRHPSAQFPDSDWDEVDIPCNWRSCLGHLN
jgi:2-deoxy-D-gluconate 3-dehydrogenase